MYHHLLSQVGKIENIQRAEPTFSNSSTCFFKSFSFLTILGKLQDYRAGTFATKTMMCCGKVMTFSNMHSPSLCFLSFCRVWLDEEWSQIGLVRKKMNAIQLDN